MFARDTVHARRGKKPGTIRGTTIGFRHDVDASTDDAQHTHVVA
jgi:hypothetical protein